MFLLTVFLYMVNFSVNDIWTENESFYADAVREMTESGNYIDIKFNGEPRFNKPPLTYWLIVLSSRIFGLNEFGIRLPFVILSFGTILLVWSMARMLYGEKTAMIAFAMQAVSIQYISLKAYASPETPLAFFFTLTLFFFLKARLSGKTVFYYLSAVALGLTVLTKGYPYIIVICGIIIFYLLMESDFKLKSFFVELKKVKPMQFVAIALLLGCTWIFVMIVKYGNAYLHVLNMETLHRAASPEEHYHIGDLFFYPYVILWGFYPYSLIFAFALYNHLFVKRTVKDITFAFSWFLVMLVIFTVAKGKIPTYFIQANPALVLIAASFAAGYKPEGKVPSFLWGTAFVVPVITGLALCIGVITVFQLPAIYFTIPLAALILLVSAMVPADSEYKRTVRQLSPFIATSTVLLVFSTGILPLLEKWRPVDAIGRVINQECKISKTIPLYLQGQRIHNLSFYAARKVIINVEPNDVFKMNRPYIALVDSETIPDSLKMFVCWKGYIYSKQSSESRFMIFLRSYLDAEKGDMSGFKNYSLIYRR